MVREAFDACSSYRAVEVVARGWRRRALLLILAQEDEIMVCRILLAAISTCVAGICGEANAISKTEYASPEALGISFIAQSTSTLLIQRDGRNYVVDLVARTVREADPPQAGASPARTGSNQTLGATIFKRNCESCHGADGKGVASTHTPNFMDPKVQASLTDENIQSTITKGRPGTTMPGWSDKLSEQDIKIVAAYVRSLGSPAGQPPGSIQPPPAEKPKIYRPGDDVLMTLPTGRRLDAGGLYVNFSHRFAFDPAFSGPAEGSTLAGLDSFGLASFGFRYGLSKDFSVGVERSPTFIGRPIQLTAAYNFLSESSAAPLNAAVRFTLEGENDFERNFAESFELIVSRSLDHIAQIYVVPTFSFNARPLFSPFSIASQIPSLPGYNTFSIGFGGAVDVRPTVALIAEFTPTFVNGTHLGIHRPAYAFGIQKKLLRHAFTFGFTNAPGVTASQRASTSGVLMNGPGATKPSALFIGFDLMRQVH
jgi:mono/diheme cytochrome c family protein